MAYTSKSDAVAKLIEPKTDHNGLLIYSNNLLFDSTTIFYSDSAKTTLATAGNYVFTTNYNSIYVTIGSDGKIIGTASHTNAVNSDTTWIDDRIYQNGSLVSNQGSIGGTDLSISNYLIFDSVWASRPYINGDKAWLINNGKLNFTAMSGIDVSDMKGYDLMIYSGEYLNYTFQDWNWIQAFCHIKADVNRQTIFGNKIYFFKPDYWIPNSSFLGGVTYFRRMPNVTSINDRYGRKKLWIDMASPVHDFAENYGVPRTSTKFNKGLTHGKTTQAYGYTQDPEKLKRIYFINDSWIIDPISYLYLGYIDTNYMESIWSDYFQNWAVALVESLVVDDNTWANGYSSVGGGFKYSDANPYHWKTVYTGGTGAYGYSPAYEIRRFFFSTHPYNSDQIQPDGEYYYKHVYSSLFGQAFNEMRENAMQDVLYNLNEINNGAVNVNFSTFGTGLYLSQAGGAGTTGWNSINTSNLETSDLYNHYNGYYINGTLTSNSIVTNKFFLGGYKAHQLSFITNYQIDPIYQWEIYGLVHNYDISKKVFTEKWGTENHSTRVMSYTWILQEILPGQTGNSNIRSTFPYQNGSRPEQSPSLNQSIAVWSMAYADGFFAWNDANNPDEFNTTVPAMQLGRASWDWAYVGYWQVYQNKDIVEANNAWLVPDLEKSAGVWTTATENYPVSLYAYKRPICRYKLSADGTSALIICTNPFNNGYTKATFKFRLPAKSNYEFTIDTWGTYTSVVRLNSL